MIRSCLFLVVVFVVGCGADKSPVEKCDDLVDVICDRAVQCVTGGGTHGACVQELQQALPCGSVTSVSASYDRCMDQLTSFGCGTLFPIDRQTGEQTIELPADCMNVVLSRVAGPALPLGTLDGARLHE